MPEDFTSELWALSDSSDNDEHVKDPRHAADDQNQGSQEDPGDEQQARQVQVLFNPPLDANAQELRKVRILTLDFAILICSSRRSVLLSWLTQIHMPSFLT